MHRFNRFNGINVTKDNKNMMKFKTKEEAVAKKKKGDRLFCDPHIHEYFIISPRKYIWKEGEFEENFIIMPETFEECIKLRFGNCQDCEYLPRRHGNYKSCQRRVLLSNRESMEIFD
jgi:hypothetical protein